MKCPGQDMQYWTPGAIFEVDCPQCGAAVEFYKDDTSRKCRACGKRFVNPKMDFGCASYCQYSEQCLGTLPEEFVAQRENLLKDKVAVEMKKLFKNDFQGIGHTTRVARHAEALSKSEDANLAVVLCTAYLQNTGTTAVQKGYEAASPEDIRRQSSLIAKEILTRLGAKTAIIEQVCSLISQQMPPSLEESIEAKVLADAEKLSQLEEKYKADGNVVPQDVKVIIERIATDSGRRRAREILDKLVGTEAVESPQNG